MAADELAEVQPTGRCGGDCDGPMPSFDGERAEPITDPRHTFLTAKEVIARYGWGRTKGYQMLRQRGFPRPVGRDRYRLDALMEWEDRQLAGEDPTSAEVIVGRTPALNFPPRKRPRRKAAG